MVKAAVSGFIAPGRTQTRTFTPAHSAIPTTPHRPINVTTTHGAVAAGAAGEAGGTGAAAGWVRFEAVLMMFPHRDR